MIVSLRTQRWNAEPLYRSTHVIFVAAMPPEVGSHGPGAEPAARQSSWTIHVTNLCPSPDEDFSRIWRLLRQRCQIS